MKYRNTITAALVLGAALTASIGAQAEEASGAVAARSITSTGPSTLATGTVNDAWFREGGVDIALVPLPSICNFGSRFMSATDPNVNDTLRALLTAQPGRKLTVYVEVQNNWCVVTQVNAIPPS